MSIYRHHILSALMFGFALVCTIRQRNLPGMIVVSLCLLIIAVDADITRRKQARGRLTP